MTDQINKSIAKAYTSEDVRAALQCMRPLKSPGSDGLPIIFYKKFWRIVGDDATK